MSAWRRWPLLLRPLAREEGQDLAEYALLIGLIAILVVASVTTVGVVLKGRYNVIIDGLAAVL